MYVWVVACSNLFYTIVSCCLSSGCAFIYWLVLHPLVLHIDAHVPLLCHCEFYKIAFFYFHSTYYLQIYFLLLSSVFRVCLCVSLIKVELLTCKRKLHEESVARSIAESRLLQVHVVLYPLAS